jgi:1,4-dihydroxy-2-naphthoate octaprenyltransferase
MTEAKKLLGPMRVPFLLLTPACVLLGLGAAVWETDGIRAVDFLIVLLGALAAHVSVNAFNEYFDFRSGLDLRTRRTPFSGGSGTLPENPHLAGRALGVAVVSALVTALVGIYFLQLRGLGLLPLGLLGLVVILAYTPLLAHNAWLCLIAPGLGFGPLMVMGTYFSLTGRYSWTAFLASLIPFFLVNDLLLLNQFPDVEADRTVGRRNFPILIGRVRSSYIYAGFLALAFLTIVVGVLLGRLPATALLGLAALAVGLPAAVGARRHAEDIEKLMPSLAKNVIVNLVTPLLVTVGLLLG